ncbi:Ycf48-like protein [subsurface metagenome]
MIVSVGAGGSAITDASGVYTTTGLIAGTYTLTPSKSAYVFSPPTRTVSVPPSATGQDFTGERIRAVQGFDTCEAPTTAQMQTWWNNSPYRDVGIYTGGSHRACPQYNLSPEWVSEVAAQGWHFIPLWVGPQAPCTEFHHRISYDPSTAFTQGIQEADKAINKADELRLVSQSGEGPIIYYDMEGYDTRISNCRDAVNSFISGWVSGLHAQGYQAGAYGAATGSAVDDWFSIGNVPDVAWIAHWYRSRYDPNASVYGVPGVPDSHWNNHQRIRQYAGDHDEPWGDVKLNIDCDIEDVLVAIGASNHNSSGVTTAAFPSSHPAIQDMHLITRDEGWALANQRLLWTTTGGAQWTDITPPFTTTMVIESVFFLDTLTGWVMSSSYAASGGDTQLTLSHTTDGGQTWQTTSFTAFNPEDGHSPPVMTYIDFINSQTGWVVIKLPSGSNFSLGRLFKTSDSGATWAELTIPIGDPVHFITADVGWVAGGPIGDQLYMTQDGGSTWQSQEIMAQENITGYLIYDLPTFEDTQDGVIPIVRNDLTQTRVEFYVTHDGGQSWSLRDTTPISQEVAPGTKFPITIVDCSHWVMADSSSIPNLPSNVVALDFVTADIGWAYTSNGICPRESSTDGPSHCYFQNKLLNTTDGGETWTEVELPYPNNVYLPLILRNG